MNKKIVSSFMLLSLCSFNATLAASNFNYQQAQPQPSGQYYQQPMQYSAKQPLKGNVVMVPAGACVPATLTSPLSSANTTVGQSVSMLLGSDYYYNNKLIAPVGSTIYGTVIEASKAKRGSMNG